MRFSSVLLAALTISATLGVANSAQARDLDRSTLNTIPSDQSSDVQPRQRRDRPDRQQSASNVSQPLSESEATSRREPVMLSQGEEEVQSEQVDVTETERSGPDVEVDTDIPSDDAPNDVVEEDLTRPREGDIEIEETLPAETEEFDVNDVQLDGIDSPPEPSTEPGTPAAEDAPEPQVLVAEVAVVGVDGDLEDVVYNAIQTQPGRTATRSQLQADINAIFATGFFSNVRVTPEDTPLGVRVTYTVDPNPILQSVVVEGNQVLPDSEVEAAFSDQYGEILNLNRFRIGVEQINQWYQDNGYVLAQVIDAPQVADDGVVTIEVVEGVVEDIRVQFVTSEGETVDEEGNPIDGRTRDFIITREFETQPGDVFNQAQIEQDLQRLFNLGIFEDVRLRLEPGDDPAKVDMVVNVTERDTGSIAAGLGLGPEGVFGTVSYQERNFGGNNQSLSAEVQLGLRDFSFDIGFTDPWIGGDPYQTSYTVNAFNRRTISSIFDGGEREVTLPDDDKPRCDDCGDRPRVNRLGGGVRFTRPLDEWLGWEDWTAFAGFSYQHVTIRDADNNIAPEDALGNNLSFSDTGEDDLFMFQVGLVNDSRNDALQPTSGSVFRFNMDQTAPIGSGSILMNRLRSSYSFYVPVNFIGFSDGPETFAFNVQGGTILGDVPPYEAFALGGTDSVRGYDFGELGTGQSYFQATVEYRFPVFSIVRGVLFADFGTDLGTADEVPGNPAGIREKPGTGAGFGVGVRLDTPLGPLRLDYGINDQGDTRFHFGIGERF